MACASGPKIIKDSSLILNLDAANVKSYGSLTDSNSNNISLLLDFEGTNGSTTFTDKSINGFTITAVGNAQISTSQAKYGTTAGYFDGNGDSITAPASSAFAVGTGDFTAEGWFYSLDTGSSLRGMIDFRTATTGTNGLMLRENSGGFLVYLNNATLFSTSTGRIANQWQHVALVRSGTTLTLYVDGTSAASVTNSTNLTDNNMRISGFIDTVASPYGYYGYIDNIQIAKYAKYTSNFTPSQLTSFPGIITNLKGRNSGALKGGPTYSSGNKGYLTFTRASNTYIDYGAVSGSFTSFSVIVWFYPTNMSSYENILDCNYAYNGTTGNIGPRLEMTTAGNLAWIYSNITNNNDCYYTQDVITSGMTANSWYCVGITYDGTGNSSVTYLNGLNTGKSRGNGPFCSSATGFIGVMNNLRIAQGFSLASQTTQRGFDGRVSLVQIYNRVLTATEVYNNYVADKGRFGL